MEHEPKNTDIVEVETWDQDNVTKVKPEQVMRRGKELTAIIGGTVHKINELNIDNPKADLVLESEQVRNMSVAELEDLIVKLQDKLGNLK
jgi:hypothetical protein